ERESAMVAASLGKAKILGLEPPNKQEIKQVGGFSEAQSTSEIVDQLIKDAGCQLTDQLRAQVKAEVRRNADALAVIFGAAETARAAGGRLPDTNRNFAAGRQH